MRILSLDISLTSPGFAVIELFDGNPRLIDVIHIKTDDSLSRGERLQHIEFALTRFLNKHKPFDVIVREDFSSKFAFTQKAIYTAWGVCETVLSRYGYTFLNEINPKTMKLVIGGSGSAEKIDVETGVRKLLNLKEKFIFKKDDESDACGIALAYLIAENKIPPLHPPKEKKKTARKKN
jgi:crossover junction endodeoxyribonuclease RuvC